MVTSLLKKLPRDLWTLRAPTAALAVLVMSGVAVLVSSWSSYESLLAAQKNYYTRFRMADVFATCTRAPRPVLEPMHRWPGVDTVEVRLAEDLLVDVPGQAEPALGHFLSIPGEGQPLLNRLYLRSGRWPRVTDPPEVMVHEAFAQVHRLKPGDSFSGLFRGRRRLCRVSGVALSPEYVYALDPRVSFPDNKHFGVFWMPRPSLEKLLSLEGAFNDVVLRLSPGAREPAVRAALDRLLAPYGCLGSVARDKQLSHRLVSDEIRQQKIQALLNPAIFLLVAAFLIHIVLSRLVALHRPQIATLKALGYGDSAIAGYYVTLAGGMALAGVLPGLALGAELGALYANLYRDFFRFPQLAYSISGSAVVLGLVAGLCPALLGAAWSVRSVVRLTPAEALRRAVPQGFSPGVLSDLPGIRHVPPLERLVLRGLVNRPLRSALTVLGVASAMAIVINGGFWRDTLNLLLSLQFESANREEVSVDFQDPRPPAALRELARMPGVIAVEGVRSVAVRLRARQLTRELALVGLPPNGGMRRVLTVDGAEVRPPRGGLLLSRSFQSEHGLRAGDPVELEVMEGGRRRRWFTLQGFTDDLVGPFAYVALSDLHRFLDEPPVFNAATLHVEAHQTAGLYRRLKACPQVITVHVKTLLYRGFQETIAGMIQVFTLALIFFAVAIAVAVIYNAAQVTLSERGWELASLRVLGFSVKEVWGLAFSELALPVYLALLPGAGFGLFLSWLSAQLVHTEQFSFPLRLSAATYALGVCVLVGTLWVMGGWLWRAVARLSLAEALKSND